MEFRPLSVARPFALVGVTIALLVSPDPAQARDPAPDIQQFKPVLDMHGFTLVYDATLQPALRAGVGVSVNGAVRPFEVNAEGQGRQFGLVDRLVGVDLTGVFAITDWLEVGGTVPIAQVPVQTAFVEYLGGAEVAWSMGDIRLEARARIVNPSVAPIGVAANVFLNLPSGNELASLGRGLPSGGARIILSQARPHIRIAANLGFGLYPAATVANLTTQHEFTYGIGLALSPVPAVLDVQLEIDGSLTGGPSEAGLERFADGPHSPLEFLAGVRGHLPHGFSIYVGAGRGLSPGFGSPALRVFANLQWALRSPPDIDGDGIRNRKDVCRNEAEDLDGFEDDDGCPEIDNDGDGVLDLVDLCPMRPEDPDGFEDADGCAEFDNDDDRVIDTLDQCPNQPEDPDGFEDEDGCPEIDNDQDGVFDLADVCPMDPEDLDGFEDADGCPEPDNDGDGVFDLADLCPMQPEAMDGVRDADGCPDDLLAIRAEDRILTFVPVRFDRRDRIEKDGAPTLMAVADLLVAEPSLGIRVEVHTDGSLGAEGLQRSTERALILRDRLLELGASPAQVDAVGFGHLKPVAVGKDAAARARNARVEFLISL